MDEAREAAAVQCVTCGKVYEAATACPYCGGGIARPHDFALAQPSAQPATAVYDSNRNNIIIAGLGVSAEDEKVINAETNHEFMMEPRSGALLAKALAFAKDIVRVKQEAELAALAAAKAEAGDAPEIESAKEKKPRGRQTDV